MLFSEGEYQELLPLSSSSDLESKISQDEAKQQLDIKYLRNIPTCVDSGDVGASLALWKI